MLEGKWELKKKGKTGGMKRMGKGWLGSRNWKRRKNEEQEGLEN